MLQIIDEIDSAFYRKSKPIYLKYAEHYNLKEYSLRMMVSRFRRIHKLDYKAKHIEVMSRKNNSQLFNWIEEMKIQKHSK